MFSKKVSLLLALFILTACSRQKPAIIIPAPSIVIEDEKALRNDLEKNIGDKVYFAFDKANLTKEAKDKLQKQAVWLNSHPSIIATIEGHCDERGTKEYNLALGLRRAESAKRGLITQGVEESRLHIVSYGKETPAVKGHNLKAWQLNRRAVTSIGIRGQ